MVLLASARLSCAQHAGVCCAKEGKVTLQDCGVGFSSSALLCGLLDLFSQGIGQLCCHHGGGLGETEQGMFSSLAIWRALLALPAGNTAQQQLSEVHVVSGQGATGSEIVTYSKEQWLTTNTRPILPFKSVLEHSQRKRESADWFFPGVNRMT